MEYRNFQCEDAKTLAWMLEQAEEEGVQEEEEGQAQGGDSHTHTAMTNTPSPSSPTLPHHRRRPSCCTHLQSLTISNNFLRKDGALALSHALSLLPSLRSLTLNDNSLYNEAATAICTSLKEGACPRLEQFSIAWNWIGVGGNKAMGALLGSGACVNLRVLDMRGNGITSVGLCFFVEELMVSMVVAREGGGGGNGEGEGKEGERGDAVTTTTATVGATSMYQRHYLHYQPDDAGSRGSSSATVPSSPCPHLTELLLAFNYIGSEGVLALAEAVTLGIFPALRTLDLSHNSVDEASEQRLREAFEGRDCNVVF